MNKIILSLALAGWAAAPVFSETDYHTYLYLQKLNNYYYSLTRAGLKNFQCEASGSLTGQEPPGLAKDWEGFDWQNSHCKYTFSYLGGEVMPILGWESDGGDPQATAARMRRVTEAANQLLVTWGLFLTHPFFDPENRRNTVTVESGSNGGFSLVGHSRFFSATVDYDNQALAQRMVLKTPVGTQEMKLGFIHLPQGAVLQHAGMVLLWKGTPIDVDLRVDYQEIQGFPLPATFTVTEKSNGVTLKAVYQMSRYSVLRKGEATAAGAKKGDEEVVPASSESPGSKHFLWRVRSSTATMYLLGSIHIRPNTPLEVPEIVEKSFQESNFVGFEFDRSKLEQIEKERDDYYDIHCSYPEGDSMRNHVTPEEWGKIQALLSEWGISTEMALHHKPYILRELALRRPPPKGVKRMIDMGIDEIFYRKAVAANKKVFGLEYWYEGFRVLDGLSDHDQVHYLLGDAVNTHNHARFFGEILADWKAGNTADVDALVNTDVMPEDKPALEKMVTLRNEEWVPQVVKILQSRAVCFIVVGSAHLVGSKGLPNLLLQKGFSVEQL